VGGTSQRGVALSRRRYERRPRNRTSEPRAAAAKIASASPADRTTSPLRGEEDGSLEGAVKKAVKKVGTSRKKVERRLGQ